MVINSAVWPHYPILTNVISLDSTIPLAQVIQAFEIYETENGSHTGKATAASKSTIR
jgi:hypothetical protein